MLVWLISQDCNYDSVHIIKHSLTVNLKHSTSILLTTMYSKPHITYSSVSKSFTLGHYKHIVELGDILLYYLDHWHYVLISVNPTYTIPLL